MLKIATPISHLFNNCRHAQHIMDNSDCLECRDRSLNAKLSGQEVYHCGIQPIHKLDIGDFHYLENIAKSKLDLKLITFHAASSCDKPYIEGHMFRMGGMQYSREEMLKNARENISRIKTIFGPQISVAVENNNYYPTEAYRWITDADFIEQIVYENEIFFLFDLAHAKVAAHNKKLNYEDYKCGLPLDKMVQIHIYRHAVDENNIAYDEHGLPGKEEWEEMKRLTLAGCNVRYLTIEYYKDTNKLIKSLKEVKEIINELS